MLRFRLALITVFAAVLISLFSLATTAQPARQDFPDDALFVSSEGDLYIYRPSTETLTPYTGCAIGSDNAIVPWQPLLRSPDRRRLAFYVYERWMLGEGFAPSPSGDLWVCDLADGTAQRVSVDTTPPNNLSDSERNNGEYGLYLSHAFWSPDGRQIAWSDFVWNEVDPKRLVVYDVETRQTRVIAMLSSDLLCGVDMAVSIDWGAGGITLRSVQPSPADVCIAEEIAVLIYDADGGLIDRILLPTEQEVLDGAYPIWVAQNGSPALTFTLGYRDEAERYLLDPQTESINPADSMLALTPVDLTQGPLPPVYDENRRTLLPGAQGEGVETTLPVQIAYTAGGETLAFIGGVPYKWVDGALYLRDEALRFLDLPRFRVERLPVSRAIAPFGADATFCPPAEALPVTRSNNVLRVIPGGGANNLRSAPRRDAPVLTQIGEGETFTVLVYGGNPYLCAQGVRWRFVEYAGVRGWTAESVGSDVYVEIAG